MIITQTLQRWGNGTGIRLSKKVIEAAHLQLNQELEVTLQGRSIVLTPVEKAEGTKLAALLKGVTPEKVGGELDWGGNLGREQHE